LKDAVLKEAVLVGIATVLTKVFASEEDARTSVLTTAAPILNVSSRTDELIVNVYKDLSQVHWMLAPASEIAFHVRRAPTALDQLAIRANVCSLAEIPMIVSWENSALTVCVTSRVYQASSALEVKSVAPGSVR
jgi:hypothetical protein